MADEVTYRDIETGEFYTQSELDELNRGFELVGDSYFEDEETGFIENAGLSLQKGYNSITSGLRETLGGTAEFLGYEDAAEEFRANAQTDRDEAEVAAQKQGDFAGSFTDTVISGVPQVALPVAGSLIASPVALAGGALTLAASAGGNKYRQLEDAGEERALDYAVMSGLSDAAMNVLGGRLIGGLRQPASRLGSIATTLGTEAVEEGGSEVFDIGIDYASAIEDPSLSEAAQRVLTSAGAGAVLGGGLEAGVSVLPKSVRSRGLRPSDDGRIILPEDDNLEIITPEYEDTYEINGERVTKEEYNAAFKAATERTVQDTPIQNNNDYAKDLAEYGNKYGEKQSYQEYIDNSTPDQEVLNNLQETTDGPVTEEVLQDFHGTITQDAQKVILPNEETISPIIPDGIDEKVEDTFDTSNFEIKETDNTIVVEVNDQNSKDFEGQRGALRLGKNGDPINDFYVNNIRELPNFEDRTLNDTPAIKLAKNNLLKPFLIAGEMARVLRKTKGFHGLARAVEDTLDIKYQMTGFARDAVDRLQPFYQLDEQGQLAVGKSIIQMRIDDHKKSAMKFQKEGLENRVFGNRLEESKFTREKYEKRLRGIQIRDKKSGQVRTMSNAEVDAALAIHDNNVTMLDGFEDAELRVKFDGIDNNVDAMIGALDAERNKGRIGVDGYDIGRKELEAYRTKLKDRAAKQLRQTFSNLRQNPYLPISRFGKYMVGVRSESDQLIEYHAVENVRDWDKKVREITKKTAQKVKQENIKRAKEGLEPIDVKNFTVFKQERVDPELGSNPYYNVPTPILREISKAEKRVDFTKVSEETIGNLRKAVLDGDRQVLTEIFQGMVENHFQDATGYYRNNLSASANADTLGFKTRFIEPTFVPGWSTDFRRGLNKYVHDAARYTSARPAHSRMMREITKLGSKHQHIKNWATRHVEDTFRNTGTTKIEQMIASGTYHMFLGVGAVRPALSNFIGGATMLPSMLNIQIRQNGLSESTLPSLLKGAAANTGQYYANRQAFLNRLQKKDAGAVELILEAEKQGMFDTGFYDQFIAEAKGLDPKSIHKIMRASDKFFRVSEGLIRTQSFLASLEATRGQDGANRMRLAKELVRQTAGDFSAANRAPITRGTGALGKTGRFAFMFKNWMPQHFANLKQMINEVGEGNFAPIMSYSTLMMMITGAHKSIPFLSDMLDVLQSQGLYDYEEMEEYIGEVGMDIYSYGAMATAMDRGLGYGADLSSSGGGGGLLPRDGVGGVFLGPVYGIGKRMFYGYQDYMQGLNYKVLEDTMPMSVSRKLQTARTLGLVDGYPDGVTTYNLRPISETGTTDKPLKVSHVEALFNFIGIPSVKQSKSKAEFYRIKRLAGANRNYHINNYLSYIFAFGTPQAQQRAIELADQNGVRYNKSTINRNLKELGMTAEHSIKGVRKDDLQAAIRKVKGTN